VNLLEFINTSGTYDGAITLNNALNIGVRSSGATGVTINGVISGDGDLIKGQYQDGDSGVLILAGANTYTGDTLINNGAFTLAATTGSLTFVIGADGVNNQVTASATHSGAVTFNGTFNFDLGGAVLEDGNSWLIVDKAKLTNTSFTSTFAVNGFSESGNIWTNGSGLSFSEASGILSYTAVPEPSTYATLIGVGALGLCLVRRRQTA
jgi:autotransporter-associated beta strand protein